MIYYCRAYEMYTFSRFANVLILSFLKKFSVLIRQYFCIYLLLLIILAFFLLDLDFIQFTYLGNNVTEDMIWLPKETSTLALKLVPTHRSKIRNTCITKYANL